MGKSIGVMNVNARVKSVYGEGYGIHYENGKDAGTKAVIILPVIKQITPEQIDDTKMRIS